MAKKRLIPFRWLPGSWGLSGKIYQEAEAHYLLEGEELLRRLIDIRFDSDPERAMQHTLLDYKNGAISAYERDVRLLALRGLDLESAEGIRLRHREGYLTAYERDMKLLALQGHHAGSPLGIEAQYQHRAISEYQRDVLLMDAKGVPADSPDRVHVDHKHGMISDLERDEALLALSFGDDLDSTDYKVQHLDLVYSYGKMDKTAYDKERATILKEPWIGIIDQGFDAEQGVNGIYFEFDWNDFWIEYLRLNGYTGVNDGHLVEQWFADVCRSQASEADHAHLSSARFGGNVTDLHPAYRA